METVGLTSQLIQMMDVTSDLRRVKFSHLSLNLDEFAIHAK